MPAIKGPLWQFFLTGEKQNESHSRAHCRGCIEAHRPEGEAVEIDESGNVVLQSQSWVVEGMYHLLVLSMTLTCSRSL